MRTNAPTNTFRITKKITEQGDRYGIEFSTMMRWKQLCQIQEGGPACTVAVPVRFDSISEATTFIREQFGTTCTIQENNS